MVLYVVILFRNEFKTVVNSNCSCCLPGSNWLGASFPSQEDFNVGERVFLGLFLWVVGCLIKDQIPWLQLLKGQLDWACIKQVVLVTKP